jgi:hypothetical protein
MVSLKTTPGQHYMIPPDPEHPEIDCYLHMTHWLSHLRDLIPQSLEDDGYVFPAIASTGLLKFGEHITRLGFETLMDSIIKPSRVMNGHNGKFKLTVSDGEVCSIALCGQIENGVSRV